MIIVFLVGVIVEMERSKVLWNRCRGLVIAVRWHDCILMFAMVWSCMHNILQYRHSFPAVEVDHVADDNCSQPLTRANQPG